MIEDRVKARCKWRKKIKIKADRQRYREGKSCTKEEGHEREKVDRKKEELINK